MTDTASQVIRRLAMPVYVPSLLSAVSSSAVVPMVPLIAISLGFSTATAALIVALLGLVAVVGPIPIGLVMEKVGERAAMVGGAALSLLASVGVLSVLGQGPSSTLRWLFLGFLALQGVAGEVWDLGRQTYLSAELPPQFRGRAMNLFGGTLRIGGVVGPTLGAAAVGAFGFAGSYYLSMVLMVAAAVLVIFCLVPSTGRVMPVPVAVDAEQLNPRGLHRHVVRAMLVVGVGLAALLVARINVAVVVPLVGHDLGLSPSTISLVFAAGTALEVLLFLPAGFLLDHWGRGIMGALCCIGLGLGFILMALVPQLAAVCFTPLAWLMVARLVIASGNALGSGIVKTLGADLAPTHRRSAHLGLYNSITGVGQLGGPVVVSAVTAVAGIFVASAFTGGVALLGAVWLWLVLPRYTPGWHGHLPENFHPDRPPGTAASSTAGTQSGEQQPRTQ